MQKISLSTILKKLSFVSSGTFTFSINVGDTPQEKLFFEFHKNMTGLRFVELLREYVSMFDGFSFKDNVICSDFEFSISITNESSSVGISSEKTK